MGLRRGLCWGILTRVSPPPWLILPRLRTALESEYQLGHCGSETEGRSQLDRATLGRRTVFDFWGEFGLY